MAATNRTRTTRTTATIATRSPDVGWVANAAKRLTFKEGKYDRKLGQKGADLLRDLLAFSLQKKGWIVGVTGPSLEPYRGHPQLTSLWRFTWRRPISNLLINVEAITNTLSHIRRTIAVPGKTSRTIRDGDLSVTIHSRDSDDGADRGGLSVFVEAIWVGDRRVYRAPTNPDAYAISQCLERDDAVTTNLTMYEDEERPDFDALWEASRALRRQKRTQSIGKIAVVIAVLAIADRLIPSHPLEAAFKYIVRSFRVKASYEIPPSFKQGVRTVLDDGTILITKRLGTSAQIKAPPFMISVYVQEAGPWVCPTHGVAEDDARYLWRIVKPNGATETVATDVPYEILSFTDPDTEFMTGRLCARSDAFPRMKHPFAQPPDWNTGDHITTSEDARGTIWHVARPETNPTPITLPPGARELPSPSDPPAGSPTPAPTGSR